LFNIHGIENFPARNRQVNVALKKKANFRYISVALSMHTSCPTKITEISKPRYTIRLKLATAQQQLLRTFNFRAAPVAHLLDIPTAGMHPNEGGTKKLKRKEPRIPTEDEAIRRQSGTKKT
jgi:hypothetical protein